MGAAAPSGIRWRPALLVAMAALAAQALPVALVIFQSSVRPKFISSTYGPPYILFELFGFSGSLFIGLALWIGSRSQPPSPIRQLRLLAFAVVACSALLLITECTQESYDYRCYQAAAQAFLAGTPAYGQGYIYPPLMATGLAAFYRVLGPLLGFPEKITWYLVFYAWQTLQFFLYVGAFELTLQAVWRRLPASRSPRNTAILLCATTLIFVVNNALLRTMRFNQVNLLVLDSALVALLLFERFPVVAALSLAFGIHLKLYPLLLAVPLLLLRRLRDALLVVVMCAALFALQAYGFRNAGLWKEFFSYVLHLNTGTFLRDSSIHGIFVNTVAFLGGRPEDYSVARTLTVAAWYLAIGAYYLRRELRALARGRKSVPPETGEPLQIGLMLDTLPFLVLASPMVWEHHWVLMMPFAIACLYQRLLSYPKVSGTVRAAVFIALIYWVPTFDMFPVSYCRLVGLFGLLAITDRKGI